MYAIRSYYADEKTNFPDPTDRASLESDRNFELRIRDRERKLIMKIREAIERISDGTRITSYNVCYTKLLRLASFQASRPVCRGLLPAMPAAV